MADRSFHDLHTQGVNHVQYTFRIKITSGAPVFAEGDTADSATGSYATLADTGTGLITLTTTNAFAGFVGCTVTVHKSTPSLNAVCNTGAPSQDATTGKWSIEILTGTNAAGTFSAADLAAGDSITVVLVLRNSKVKP